MWWRHELVDGLIRAGLRRTEAMAGIQGTADMRVSETPGRVGAMPYPPPTTPAGMIVPYRTYDRR